MSKFILQGFMAAMLLFCVACERSEKHVADGSAPSNYKHLKELDWLVGKWVDKDDDTLIETEGKWDRHKNFLTQKFSIKEEGKLVLEGFQIIGWDPINKEIRSWVFDSDGGFAEGVWSSKGGKWVVETEQTMADGKKGSSINIYSDIEKNTYTWESTGQEIGGTILPNVGPVTVRRK